MNKIISAVIIAFSLGLGACGSTSNAIDAAHNSRNSLDWPGVYRGVVPGANSDINVQITLGSDETYTISYHYIDKSNEVFTGSGTFEWNDAGSIIALDFGDKDKPSPFPPYYQVGENKLFQLNENGKRITGQLAANYELKKVQTN